MTVLDDLREDLQRYGTNARQRLASVVQAPGLWATVGYRCARWLETADLPRPLRLAGRAAQALVGNAVVVATNVQIPPAASIGRGLFIAHTGFIVISEETRIGRHCTLTQGVTIGHRAGGGERMSRSPTIGDRVYIGPGAIILGDVHIGDDALVGAGAVVVESVPPRAVVVGNPARVVSRKGSFDLIRYEGMESDVERRAALDAAAREGGGAERAT